MTASSVPVRACPSSRLTSMRARLGSPITPAIVEMATSVSSAAFTV